MSKPGSKTLFETVIIGTAGNELSEKYLDSTTKGATKLLPKYLDRLNELEDGASIVITIVQIPQWEWKHGYDKVKAKDVVV
jgi:hypothetical protein